ncbi:MAG: hypothetical protein QGI49_08360 [SAR202 cluster bacterium]|jgi:hypothetical protein|nr:hypothetical protein [SAR202 cluster bacterium]
MAIFGFGKARKLQDISIKDPKKEKIGQEFKQQQLLSRMRRAGEQHDALLEMTSEPGTSDAEIDAAAYKMSQLNKTKDRTERELQEVNTRVTVIDSTLDVINQKEELEKSGVWKKINEIPEEQLEEQLLELSVDRVESQVNVSRIAEVFDVDRQVVRSNRSADVLRSRKTILEKRTQKLKDDNSAT